MVIKHTPTESMWADMNTKPKQGRAFHIDRSKMMNCPEDLSQDDDDVNNDRVKTMSEKIKKQNTSNRPTMKTHIPHDTKPKHVTWESSQECVGSGRKLGGRETWDVVTSTLARAPKRLM